jgi:hypothetical protein
MNCTIATPGNGVDLNTIVAIVYGTLMLAIACVQLFIEYSKVRATSSNGEWPVSILRP